MSVRKESPNESTFPANKINIEHTQRFVTYRNFLRLVDMLSDDNIYKKVNKDPTSIYQKKINSFIDGLVEEKQVDEFIGKSLKANNTVPPKIYGLRKVHKQGCKLRPVVSCINSPCYNLARHLHKLLIPLIDTFEMNVKNSSSLVNKLSSVKLPTGYILVSLDVVSLFTMIPKDLVIEIISKPEEVTIRN
ncbi:Protein of unknown function [Cotesia congregata]|uniref:Uncharacterized protein n=1 Tax=Cotesia congregata TaxID=51543 RepID=A0A8J2H3Y9_COTCN|nr:Protein of unknown function [Cotesia congregata]